MPRARVDQGTAAGQAGAAGRGGAACELQVSNNILAESQDNGADGADGGEGSPCRRNMVMILTTRWCWWWLCIANFSLASFCLHPEDAEHTANFCLHPDDVKNIANFSLDAEHIGSTLQTSAWPT